MPECCDFAESLVTRARAHVCDNMLCLQENRVRLREEARRQRLIEKRKEEVKREIVLKVTRLSASACCILC